MRVKVKSEVLGQCYEKKDGGILFDDGTKYSNRELGLLRTTSDSGKLAIHAVKRYFKGTILKMEAK